MHRVLYAIRRIPASDLPTVRDVDGTDRFATDQELLNLGLVHLNDDLYSCVQQERRDPETLIWAVHDQAHPGEIISQGSLRERHAQLPADVAPKVLRAQVIRSSDPGSPAAVVVAENIALVAATLAEFVGDVSGAPLVDLAGAGAELEEAQRLAEIPGSGIERYVVPMVTVDAGDVLEADGLIPHRWQGESPF